MQKEILIDKKEIWLTTTEVAKIFRVYPSTVTNWANKGTIKSHRTPGGHTRFMYKDVFALAKKCDLPKD